MPRSIPRAGSSASSAEPFDDGWGSLEALADEPGPATQLFPDRARSIIAHNDSPDIPFDQSINPYRGCEHGCVYCYARPTHGYLGMSAGLDFETRIFVKHDAARFLRGELSAPGRPAGRFGWVRHRSLPTGRKAAPVSRG